MNNGWGTIEELFNEHLGIKNDKIVRVAMMENLRGTQVCFFRDAPQDVPKQLFYEGSAYFLREVFEVKESCFHRTCDEKLETYYKRTANISMNFFVKRKNSAYYKKNRSLTKV